MTFKSAIRSYSAAVRRSERDQQRRNRETAREFQQQQKAQVLHDAAKAVKNYEQYVAVLKSIHVDATEFVDWQAILSEKQPPAPVHSNTHEVTAKERLLKYKPSFFDKLFGSTKKKIAKLEGEVRLAIEKDNRLFEEEKIKHQDEYNDWVKLQDISKGILGQNPQSYADAIGFFKPFEDISEFGSQIKFNIKQHNVTADLELNPNTFIPDYILTLTKTGKLSRRDMPVSRYNELYQDYVCSCVLRITREVFAYLPVNLIVVNAVVDQIKSATGRQEKRAMVSVAVSRKALDTINFESIDPSDSMQNFTCNMKFSKTNGFSPVQKLNADTIVVY